MKPARPNERIRREAKVSGLSVSAPTLEAVNRRRLELWAITLLILLAVTVAMVLLSIGPGRPSTWWLSPALLRSAVLLLSIAFCAYAVEKEVHLRRLSALLVDERVLTAALSNRLKELSALLRVGRAINSVLALEDVLDIILSSSLELLEGNDGSVMLLDGPTHLRVFQAKGNDRIIGARIRVGDGVAGYVAQTREPLLISGEAAGRPFSNLVRRDGSPHSAMSVPLINRGQLLGVLNVNALPSRDFTEHDLRALNVFADHAAISIVNSRMFETERLRAEEMTELAQMKSDFVAAVSHELRTPLTSILGSVATMRRLDLDRAQREPLIDVVERQSHRLLRLIDQLLAQARIERDQDRAPEETVDLAMLVRAVARDYELAGRPFHLQAPDSLVLRTDPDAIHQVLVNLVDNAMKHGERPVHVILEETDGRVDLSVVDSGRGVPFALRDRIFDRFERAGNGEGLGLGLSIVRELVVACGGTVAVDDAPTGGALFRVSLPVVVADRTPA